MPQNATYLKTVVVGKKEHPLYEYFHSNKSSFVLVIFHGDHKTVTKFRLIWPPSDFWDFVGFKTVVYVYYVYGTSFFFFQHIV